MDDNFYIKQDNEEKGPFTFDEITDRGLDPDTMVRTAAYTGWERASDLPDFFEYFRWKGYYFPTEENLAGFGIRLAAYLIDQVVLVILLVIGISIYVAVKLPGADMNAFVSQHRVELNTIIAPCAFVLYFTIMGATPLSASIGQFICKLIVVDADGRKLNPVKAVVRGVGKFLSGSIFGIGFLGVLFSEYKQGFHDVLAKTYVVRKNVY